MVEYRLKHGNKKFMNDFTDAKGNFKYPEDLAGGGRAGFQIGGSPAIDARMFNTYEENKAANEAQRVENLRMRGMGQRTAQEPGILSQAGTAVKNFGNKLTDITDSTLSLGTPFATYFTSGNFAPRTTAMDKNLEEIVRSKISPLDIKKGNLSGTIGYSDYDKSQAPGTGLPDLTAMMKNLFTGKIAPEQFANATTLGRLTYDVDPMTGKLNLGSNEYNFRPEVAED